MTIKAKKLVSILLIIMLVFSSTITVFADEDAEANKEVQKKQEEQLQAKKEAEKKAAEEKAKKEAEKKAAEEKAKKEAEEKARKAAEEKAAEEAAAEAENRKESDDSSSEDVPSADQEQAEPSEESETESGTDEIDIDESKPADDASENEKSTLKLQAELSDGTYKPDSFEFSGGTGKAKVTCEKVILKDGVVWAEFTASSENMTHFYMGTVSSDAENTSLYDPSTGKRGKDVYKITDKKAYVKVVLNEKKPFAGRTTAMTDPHWVQYEYKLTLSDDAKKTSDDTTIPDQGDDQGEDSGDTGLTNGTYKPESFDFSGGTGKAKVTCEKVIVKDGKAWAEFTASSENMTHFYMGTVSSDAEDKSLYDPDTDKCGSGVYKISSKKAYVLVTLNEKKPFAGRTTAMTEPHWVQYEYKVTLTESAEKISDDTTIPGEEGDDPDPGKDDPEPTDPDDPADTKELADGTYKVQATTDRRMFYLYPKEKNPATVILVKKNGKMTATITLTGDGYNYVYMGTPAQAKAAGKSKWIKYKKVNGYYTFTIPVSKLDKKLDITPHSSKYASDGDPSTEPWRPDKWILFYSAGAKKVKDGSSITPSKKKSSGGSSKTDKKAEKESKYKDDSGKSTSAVNNSTSLKDGVYKPDRFSWSGGSGRLAYIRCNKITVRGGKAFATIEFGSSKYDSLKANGRIYSKSGGGNSKFTIPVKLNANNTIIGRTTAMSQPHWVKYRIFIYKKGAEAKGGNKNAATGDDGHLTSTKKLSEKAPDLLGLEFKEAVEIKYASYFKIFKYEQGITLISVDQSSDTALYKEDKEKDNKSGNEEADSSEEKIEYDEDGKPIAKAQNEITEELYNNNVVNYLIVPEKAEIPAGLEKDCVIISQPVKASYISADPILTDIIRLGHLDQVAGISMEVAEVKDKKLKKAIEKDEIQALGDREKPDYASIVKMKADFAVLPDTVLPAKITKKSTDDEKKESEEASAKLNIMQSRFAALGVPTIIDRSEDEKTNYATAEWIKVYGAVYGEEQKAEALFEDYTKKNKEEENA